MLVGKHGDHVGGERDAFECVRREDVDLKRLGAVLAVIDTGQVQTLTYCTQFNTGLTIVTAGGTPPDLTVSYV